MTSPASLDGRDRTGAPAAPAGPGSVVPDRRGDLVAGSVVGLGTLALAARPAGDAALLVTLAVGAAALVVPSRFQGRAAGPRMTSGADHLWWSVTVGVGVLAFGTVRLSALSAPAASPPWPSLALATTLAGVAEEAFFRQLAYGWLERWGPAIAVTGAALLFAAVHVPVYGPSAFPIDLGAGLLFGWQRWATKGWSAPAATHVAANLMQLW